jgi:hypothetical protein
LHQYIGGKLPVPPIGKKMQKGSTNNYILWIFLMLARWLAAQLYWCVVKAIEMLAAHCLFGRPLPIQSAAASRKEKKIIKDVGKIKRQKNVHQQGPKPNASICYLCDPSNFSSVPTFKRRHDEGGIGKKFETLISKRILN